MKRKLLSLLFVLLLLSVTLSLFSSCGSEESPSYPELPSESEPSYSLEDAGSERKVIKTVDETLETEHFDEFMDTLKSTLSSAGGYISSARYYGEEGEGTEARSAHFIIRIPSEKLESFTDTLKATGTVTSYYERADDVTLEYVDVESRISVLEAEEDALTEMLAQAKSTDEILSIRNQLNSVQQTIASLRAQKQTYDDRISYSTVNLNVVEVEVEKPVEHPGFFREVGEVFSESLSDIGGAFRAFGVWFFGNILRIILWGGIVTGIVFLVLFFVRLEKKKNGRQ